MRGMRHPSQCVHIHEHVVRRHALRQVQTGWAGGSALSRGIRTACRGDSQVALAPEKLRHQRHRLVVPWSRIQAKQCYTGILPW